MSFHQPLYTPVKKKDPDYENIILWDRKIFRMKATDFLTHESVMGGDTVYQKSFDQIATSLNWYSCNNFHAKSVA
ncbi:MAG: hypothetical protein QNL62_21765 [Gammaproteobacteria bacterium]|nr:hypothetical protein [Gammaproteobacteria bacterium]